MDTQQRSTVVIDQLEVNKSELGNLSIRDLFYKYVRFLPLFILSVALALLGAYLYLRYTVPIYSVAGSMLIKNEKMAGDDRFSEIFGGNRTQNIQSEIEILKSRPLMERVVNKLNLQFSYFVEGKIKTVNIYKGAPFTVQALKIRDSSRSFSMKIRFQNDLEFRINNEKKIYRFGETIENAHGSFVFIRTNLSPASNDYNLIWQPTSSAAGVYASAIQVMPRSVGTGILNISMRTPNSYLGADILNKLMEEYGDYSVEQKKQSSDQILTFIDDRLTDYGNKLDSVQRMYLDYQRRYNIIDADVQSSTYFGIISEADKEINSQLLSLSIADMLEGYLLNKRNEFNRVVVPSALGLDDPTLNGLVGNYNKVQLDRKQLVEANIPTGNPMVLELNDQIEQLRVSILENIRNIKNSYRGLITQHRTRSGTGEAQLRSMPVKVKELAEIKRQVETYQGLYKLLQEKKEETAITRASTISNTEIIDRAYPTSTPIKPNRKAIQMMAVLLGIALPAVFIFIGEVLNDKVTTRFDIEKLTRAPILGEIGHSFSDEVMVVNKTTRSMVAEQFRIIRSNLQYILNKQDRSVILVTSSFSGEGKSYVSINMGAVMALAGKKTVILEFDIRKPKVLSGLGMSRGPGITNYLLGKGELSELIRPVKDQENLFVLGCGPIPPNPAELLLDPRVDEMFDWLRAHFDIVLVDTAPVGMVSDAMTLGKFADSTLYLVRQGHTFKKQVALIEEFYQEKKLPRVSVIINDVKLKPGYGYYGYGRYGYGYGYGYGSYYEEEHAPMNTFEKLLTRFDIRRFWGNKKRKKKAS